CKEGWFGVNCSRTCPRICPPDECDKVTGKCMKCLGRRIGPKCQDCFVISKITNYNIMFNNINVTNITCSIHYFIIFNS
ncbi:unnamed protein product, partial [Candidula unifasciata]